jgi:uncharacterized protein YneF (UPF0154 family)
MKEKLFLLEPWVFLIHIHLCLLTCILCGVFIESVP